MSYAPDQSPTSPSPFEQASTLAYALHTRYHSHNNLVVPPFGEETGGIVLPVVTTLKFQESPRQRVEVQGNTIDISQRYPELTAAATYVGLWPQGDNGAGTAALYKSKVAFTPAAFGGQLPFRETMNDLFAGLSPIEQTDEADVRGAVPAVPPRLRGTPNSRLIDGNVGYNSVEKTRFWRPALSGEVMVEIAEERIVKITDNTVLSAAKKMISLEVAGEDEQIIPDAGFHTLPEDASLVLDKESGEIRIKNADGTIESPTPPYTLNPLLADLSQTVYERAAEQLEWKDITDHTLRHSRHLSRFYREIGFSPDEAYNAIQEQALQQLVEARQGLKPEPIATIGVVSYLETLRHQDHTGGGHIVTRRYTEL